MPNPYPPLHLTITLLLLITACSGYSIAGPWKLQLDKSYKNIDMNASIVFDFVKEINNRTISSYLSVYACAVVDFTYTLADSAMSFYLKKIGVNRRDCVKDQIGEIIGRIDKVAFTTTIGNKLLLLSPSGKIIFKLTKLQKNQYTYNITGLWSASEINYEPTSIMIKANDSQIQLCNGNAVIDYKMLHANTFDVRVRQTKGCPQNDLLTGLYKSRYVRSFGDQIWFYDGDIDVLMKWINLANLAGDQPIVFQKKMAKVQEKVPISNDTLVNGTADQSTNITVEKVGNKNVVPLNSKKDTDSLDTLSNDRPIIQATTNIGVTPPPSTLPPLVAFSRESTPIPPVSIINTLPTPPPIIPPQVTLPPPPPPVPAPIPAPIPAPSSNADNRPSYLTTIKKQAVFSKWYLINSPAQILAIITSNRIMVYGVCGVWFTLFNLKDPVFGKVEVFNNEAKNTTPSCLGKKSNIQYLVSNLKFLTVRQNVNNSKILSFWNKDNKIIGEWANFKQK